jgi:hypothetical protein
MFRVRRGSHGGDCECGTMYVVLETCQHFGIPCMAYPTVKMEATDFSKMSINFFQTMQCHIPEDDLRSQDYFQLLSVCVLCWSLYFLVVISTNLPYISLVGHLGLRVVSCQTASLGKQNLCSWHSPLG